MVEGQLPVERVCWSTLLSEPRHGRRAWRLLPRLRGLLVAQGRRTVSRWLPAAGRSEDCRQDYYVLGSLGRQVECVAARLLHLAVTVLVPGDRRLFGLDDTPSKRYGRKVHGAGMHHKPSPGPADQQFLYGQVWVSIAWLVRHPLWGAIGRPRRAWL